MCGLCGQVDGFPLLRRIVSVAGCSSPVPILEWKSMIHPQTIKFQHISVNKYVCLPRMINKRVLRLFGSLSINVIFNLFLFLLDFATTSSTFFAKDLYIKDNLYVQILFMYHLSCGQELLQNVGCQRQTQCSCLKTLRAAKKSCHLCKLSRACLH